MVGGAVVINGCTGVMGYGVWAWGGQLATYWRLWMDVFRLGVGDVKQDSDTNVQQVHIQGGDTPPSFAP